MAITQRGSVLVAADAAVNDGFGRGVALSSDGAIMAVGAWGWEGSAADQGGVYVFDYTGGSWVLRGSVLESGSVENAERFGFSVSLSADGTIMAVGAPYNDATLADRGGVYIFDYTGGSWVLRGSVILAADGATSDLFATGVSLSADGTVLAVGAEGWEGGASGQGGVYIFDYTGGSWVQRGSVLVAPDASSGDAFGSAVCLSSDATILAVGARSWEGAFSNVGGVYIFDWNSGTSAWDQRGSVLSPGAALFDGVGSGVALSGNGLMLAVGALAYDASAIGNSGAAWVYDWGESDWVLRGSMISAADAADSDGFGYAVALSRDGNVLGVGARDWEDAVSGQGGVYVYDITSETGAPVCYTELLVVQLDIGAPVGYTELTVSLQTGIPVCRTKLTVTASGTPTAPTLLAVTDLAHVATWTARCLIDGVDVSAQLVGQASVVCDEGAARIASLMLQPPSGTVAPLDYVGKTISLDYVLVIAGVDVPRRLFTGRIDTPDYDPNTTLLRLDCVDDLQNRVAALDRTVIDGLVGGRYTEAVQGEILDNWDYAEARLSTVAASLDAGASGGMRVTPWELATTWASFGEGDLLYQQSRVTYPQRSTLINKVSIEFDYRYPRLRQRYTSIGWSGTYIDMAPNGFQYPTQQDIAGAAGGSGWIVTKDIYWPAPAAIPYGGKFVFPRDGAIDMAVLFLTQRHSQTVTEHYPLTVEAPESIAANGELPHALRGALESEFDGQAWESALDVAPLMATGGEQDWAPDAPREDADYAIQTLLDQARVKILGSHRSARLTNAVLCNPDLDLDKKVAIATAGMNAAGKVSSVTHTLDLDAGSAVSEFSIACFGVGGAGIITPDTLEPPAPPAEAAETQDWYDSVPSLAVATYGVTPYQEGLMGLLLNPSETITIETSPGVGAESVPNPSYVSGAYPVTGFRVQMPGVDDADRNPLEKTVAQSYSILIPSDTLTFTVP